MRQAFVKQSADHVAHAARFVEMVHVARAVGVNPCHEWDGARQFGKVAPVEFHARCARHRRDVDCVVRRSTGRQEANRGVDNRFLVHHASQGPEVVSILADFGEAMGCLATEFLSQLGTWRDKRCPRYMQTHHLHHHLVRIGRPVERTGARGMITAHLAREQFLASHLALGIELAGALLFLVRDAGTHGS